MTKYDIATAFFDMLNEQRQFQEQLPQSVEQAFCDNEYVAAQDQFIHQLLKVVLSTSEYDDLCYFAYESNTRVEIDGFKFYNLEDYWTYLDSLVK